MRPRLFRITEVRKEVEGSVVEAPISAGTMTDGTINIEAASHFDTGGGSGVLDPGGLNEVFTWESVDETNDLLHGVVRTGTAAVPIGTMVQAGAEQHVEKVASGFFDDDTEAAVEVPIPAYLWAYFSVGTRAEGAGEAVWVGQLFPGMEDDQEYVLNPAVGSKPVFDEDHDILPPEVYEPTPDLDEAEPGTKTPATPTGLSATVTPIVLVEPTFDVTLTWNHTGLNTDATVVNGLSFEITMKLGTEVAWESVSTIPSSRMLLKKAGTYAVEIRAVDVAGKKSAALAQNVVVGDDTVPPAVPTGLGLTGGAGGGGYGILFASWTPNTESDLAYYEVHASTLSGFTPSTSTLFSQVSAATIAVIRAWNGSSMTTFPYSGTGSVIHIKIIAVDTSGNKSAPSTQVVGSASQVQSADVADLQSDNYVANSQGWKISKLGNAEFQNGTFRGTVVAGSVVSGTILSMSTSGSGTVQIDGPNNRILLGSPAQLILSGAGQGIIQFAGGLTNIYGSDGRIVVGSGTGSITLDPSAKTITAGAITINGSNSTITVSGGGTLTISGAINIQGAASLSSTLTVTGTISGGTISGTNITGSSLATASGSPRGVGTTVTVASGSITLNAGGYTSRVIATNGNFQPILILEAGQIWLEGGLHGGSGGASVAVETQLNLKAGVRWFDPSMTNNSPSPLSQGAATAIPGTSSSPQTWLKVLTPTNAVRWLPCYG